jgi:protein-tyrosine phosphatase
VARQRGVELTSRGRQVTGEDLNRFDWVLAMDGDNLERLQQLSARAYGSAEVRLLRAFDPEANGHLEVPDPYFGGADGFERVHDMVERACRGLLEHIRSVEHL